MNNSELFSFSLYMRDIRKKPAGYTTAIINKLRIIEEELGDLHEINIRELEEWLDRKGITHYIIKAYYKRALEYYQSYLKYISDPRRAKKLGFKPLTIAQVTALLKKEGYNVNSYRVANKIKWYLAEKGLKKDDIMIKTGPNSYIYNLPQDFIDWVRQQFEKDKERWLTPPWTSEEVRV